MRAVVAAVLAAAAAAAAGAAAVAASRAPGDGGALQPSPSPPSGPVRRPAAAEIVEAAAGLAWKGPRPARPVRVVWQYDTVGGCTGFTMEANNVVLPFFRDARRAAFVAMGIVPSDRSYDLDFCPGTPDEDVAALREMERRAQRWAADDTGVDVWVVHRPPDFWPRPGTSLVSDWPGPFGPPGHELTLRQPPRVVVARSMFEASELPDYMVDGVRDTARLDRVWVPARFNVRAFELAGVPHERIAVVPESVDTALFDRTRTRPFGAKEHGLRLRGCNFLFQGTFYARKGIDVLLHAYASEFARGENVTLTLQTYQPLGNGTRSSAAMRDVVLQRLRQLGHRAEDVPTINVLAEPVPFLDQPRLHALMTAFVLPSHGEGWGMPAMEAMAMGRPAIATRWSGLAEFLTDENGYPLRVEAVVHPPEADMRTSATGVWAQPSGEHLRQLMRSVCDHPDEARARGRRAAADVRRYFSRERIADVYQARILEAFAKRRTAH